MGRSRDDRSSFDEQPPSKRNRETGDVAEKPKEQAAAAAEPPDDRLKFPVPSWASRPPPGTHLDVMKDDRLMQKVLIDEKKTCYLGRNHKQVDILAEHASCSRVHTLLVYHGQLQRFGVVDMDSSHGTFVGKVRLEPLSVMFVDWNTMFKLGASTRYYIIRRAMGDEQNSVAAGGGNPNDDEAMVVDTELDHLTEYNTAQNRRLLQLPISDEEARRKKRPRGSVAFFDGEIVINPEDIDPTIGRFRNLVTTAVISNSGTSSSGQSNSMETSPRKIVRAFREPQAPSTLSDSGLGFSASSLSGLVSLNAAPDLSDLYADVGAATANSQKSQQQQRAAGRSRLREEQERAAEEEERKKKYAKESWPGRKPHAL